MSSSWKYNNNNHNPYVWRRNITAGTNNRSSTRTNITWSPDGASSSSSSTSSSFNFATTSDDNNKTVYRRTKKRKKQENSSVSSSYKDSKQFKLESKTWKKEWGYGADFIEWQEKNSMDGAVLDLTTANGTMLKGGSNSNIRNTSKVINLIDDDEDDGSGMFGMKKRKFAF